MFALIWFSFCVSAPCLGKTRHSEFRKVPDKFATIEPLGVSHVAHSSIHCASHCLKPYETCNSFIYNQNTGLCSLGSWAMTSHIQALADDEDVYHNGAFCNFTANFIFFVDYYCVRLSFSPLDYVSATAECQSFGSTLLAPKTSEQLQLLEDLLINQTDALPAWVGLDNLAVKRQFRWVDDGSLLCLEQEENMFLQGYQLSEEEYYCVSGSKSQHSLFFDNCSSENIFICEVQPPSDIAGS